MLKQMLNPLTSWSLKWLRIHKTYKGCRRALSTNKIAIIRDYYRSHKLRRDRVPWSRSLSKCRTKFVCYNEDTSHMLIDFFIIIFSFETGFTDNRSSSIETFLSFVLLTSLWQSFLFFFFFFHINLFFAVKCFFSTPNRECFTEQSGKRLASCQHNIACYKKKFFLCRRLLNFSIRFPGPNSLIRHWIYVSQFFYKWFQTV